MANLSKEGNIQHKLGFAGYSSHWVLFLVTLEHRHSML